MARYNSAANYLTRAAAIVSGPPLTMACWVYADSATKNDNVFMSVSDHDTAFNFLTLRTGDSSGTKVMAQFCTDNYGTQALAFSSSGVPSAGTWYHAAGTFQRSGANNVSQAFLNGTGGSTSSVAATAITGLTETNLFRLSWTSPVVYHVGGMGECAFWNAILTSKEIGSLAKRVAPESIRPENLLCVVRLFGQRSTEPDIYNQFDFTNSSTTKVQHPPRINYPRKRIFLPAWLTAATGISGAISPATETDSAQALGKAKAKGISPAAETDAAWALGKAKAKGISPAAETDAAIPLTLAAANAISPATETDSAQALGKAKAKGISAATETDLAIPLTLFSQSQIAAATETDAAIPLGKAKAKGISPAAELDAAMPLGKVKAMAIAAAAELDAAMPFGRAKANTISPATETDTAVSVTASGGADVRIPGQAARLSSRVSHSVVE